MWFLKFTSLAKVTQTADELYTLRNYAWLLRRCSKLLRLHNDSPHSFLRIQSLCHKKILQFIQICINSKNAFHKRVMSKWRLVTFLGNQLKYYALSFWEYRVTKMKQSEQNIVCIWNSCVTTAAIRMKSGTGSCFANYIWMLKPSRERFYSSFGISWIRIYGRPSFGGVSTTKRFLISFDNIEFPGKQLLIDTQGDNIIKTTSRDIWGVIFKTKSSVWQNQFLKIVLEKKTFCYERSLKISEVFPKNCVLYGVSKINNSTSINFASYKHNWLRKFNFYFQPSSYPAEPEAYDRWPCRGKLTCKWNYLGLFL